MSEDRPKIITTFQNRLEIDTAVRELVQATSDREARRMAGEIAGKYGDKALPALIALLDSPDPQLRGGLGRLAALLDQDKVVPALRAVALNRRNSDQARMTAITILERFLGVAPEEAMYAGLASPEELAMQSLREVLAEAKSNRLVLIEYLQQLAKEPQDVLMSMVYATARLPGSDGVEMLRMFAQDPYPPAAEEALQALGNIADPAAALALQALTLALPVKLRAKAERSLQKLRLRGVAIAAMVPPPAEARCLASPVDGQGNQLLLFIVPGAAAQAPPEEAGTGDSGVVAGVDVLQLLIDDAKGLVEASGGYGRPAEQVPAGRPTGQLHQAAPSQSPLLEAPFDYGRRRVREALALAWEQEEPLPLAYRLLNPLLWRWTKPQPAPALPDPPAIDPEMELQLLSHPALGSWFLQSSSISLAARRILAEAETPSAQKVNQIVFDLVRRELAGNRELVPALQARLAALREWLALTEDPAAADQAAALAASLAEDAQDHPLLLQMAGIGLRIAMIGQAGGLDWRR